MKKFSILTLGLAGVLFLGCANKHISPNSGSQISKLDNKKSKYTLYMPLNQFNHLENKVNNKAPYKSLNLNTLQPVKLPKISCSIRTAKWGIIKSNRHCFCDSFYNKETSYTKAYGFKTIVFVGLLTYGLIPLIYGIPYQEECIFNENEFNKYVKNYLTQNNIDRKKLINEYIALLNNAYSKNKKLKPIYYKYERKFENYKTTPIKEKYNDETGFISNNDKIKIFINKQIDMPKQPNFNSIVNSIFPCTPMQGCLDNFNFANQQINTEFKNYEKELEDIYKNKSFIKYSYNKNTHKYDNGKGKILYYYVSVDPKTDTATYTIYRADFYDVIPYYTIQNSTIKVEELKNGEVRFTNLTNKFIDINILSIYFKDRIINIPVNLQLAPHGEKELYTKGFADIITDLNNLQGKVDFKKFYTLNNITTNDKNKKITVGLAVKYKITNSNKVFTLYKESKYPIIKLIKDKI